jgi:hypothetical protein
MPRLHGGARTAVRAGVLDEEPEVAELPLRLSRQLAAEQRPAVRGPATVGRIAPRATGRVIVDVRPKSRTSPTRSSTTPTRIQASKPRSRA